MIDITVYTTELCHAEVELGDFSEGDKLLIGCWMIADALSSIRRALGPTDVGDIEKANIVEGLMKSADILGERIQVAASALSAR